MCLVAFFAVSAPVLMAGKEEPVAHIDVTVKDSPFNRKMSELWTATPEKLSFRACNSTQKNYIFACCRQRWLSTLDGKVFDVKDRDMASLFYPKVTLTESLGEGYYRVVLKQGYRQKSVVIQGIDKNKFKRDESGSFFVENVIIRPSEDVYSYTNAAGQELKIPVMLAKHTKEISKSEFAKELKSMELGINVEVPVVTTCKECNGRGGVHSRYKIGEEIPCEACEGRGYHAEYQLTTVTW